MRKVNYFGLKLEVPDDTLVVAMDGSKLEYSIYAFNTRVVKWYNNKYGEYWLANFDKELSSTIVGTGYKGLVEPSKSKVEV
jgi:hypothetical protein